MRRRVGGHPARALEIRLASWVDATPRRRSGIQALTRAHALRGTGCRGSYRSRPPPPFREQACAILGLCGSSNASVRRTFLRQQCHRAEMPSLGASDAIRARTARTSQRHTGQKIPIARYTPDERLSLARGAPQNVGDFLAGLAPNCVAHGLEAFDQGRALVGGAGGPFGKQRVHGLKPLARIIARVAIVRCRHTHDRESPHCRRSPVGGNGAGRSWFLGARLLRRNPAAGLPPAADGVRYF